MPDNGTHCCTGKLNVALSLYGVLGVTLYFSEGFLETAARESAVAEALWLLRVTMVCFLEQEPACGLLHCNRGTGCFQGTSCTHHWSTCYCWPAWKRGPSMEYWVVFWEQGTEMTWRKSSWWMRLLKVCLPCSRRPWQDQR